MEYQGFIFTTHAVDRARLRSLSLDQVTQALRHPDRTQPTDQANTSKFIKYIAHREVHVIAKYLTNQKKWLVVSVWVRGETDPTPLLWLIITSPFRLTWWIIRQAVRVSLSYLRSKR